MPKPSTYPPLYNDALQLNIATLKEWGLLAPNQIKSDTVTWWRNGNVRGKIKIAIDTTHHQPFIVLDYKYGNEPRKYKVTLIAKESNLGKGKIWYFICPQTGKLCRKLYSIDGYFYHRKAFTGCMYESQTQSKLYRSIDKTYGAFFKLDLLNSELRRKHAKQFYAGTPTKKYLKLIKEIEKAKSVSWGEIENCFKKK